MTYIISLPIGYKPVLKHGDHDQSSHGSWATGVTEELSNWSPKEKVPDAPRNATGTTPKFWDNWEHGVDGDQFVDLYRQYAGEMLGLPVPKSDKDVGGSENYLTQRGFGASSTEAVRNQTEAVLNAIANGRPQPTLYRGMAGGSEESKALLEQFTRLEEGDTIDMPLVSTTRSLGVAQWYAVDRSRTPNDSRVILKIQEGAKGVSVNPEKSWYPSDFETITSGKFEVVGKSEVTVPYWDRRATSARTFTLRGDDGQDGQTGYRIDDPNDLSWGSVDSLDPKGKDRYDAIVSGARTGDFSRIETPTLRYTNDRQPNGVKEGRDVTVNSWKRQEPKTFTVIEVKMVEPHVVKKGADLGMTFHNLFNDIPFIRDEEEVAKHGDHDQSEHGTWASGIMNDLVTLGAFDEESEYDSALMTYSERYGVDKEGKIVGVETFEHDAIDSYSQEGYKNINAYLRESRSVGGESYGKFLQQKVDGLDSLIDKAPDMFGDKTLFRVVDNFVLEKLTPGDTMVDKGFLSTSRIDLTRDTNTRTALGEIYDTPDTVAVILPSPSKSGKGIAVDIYRTSVNDTSSVSDREKEVLLPRNTPLKFIGYKTDVGSEAQVAVFQRVDK
jgi:hypothetical protein